MADTLDVEQLQYGLEQDAAFVSALTLQGRTAEADAFIEASNYRNRLAALKTARLEPEDP